MRRREAHLRFDWSAAEIDAIAAEVLSELEAASNRVGALSATDARFENTVLAMERASTESYERLTIPLFLKYVSPDAAVREASDNCEVALQKLSVNLQTREDLYRAVEAAVAKKEKLAPEEEKIVEEQRVAFQRNGLALDAAKREQFREGRRRLVELEAEFSRRLVEWDETVEVDEAELAGVAPAFVTALDRTPAGKLILRLTAPHYQAVMENATNPETRKKFELAFGRRGGERNKELLEETLQLRHEMAQLMGYESHAAYVLERRMAKAPAQVDAFLDRLRARLIPKGQSDIAMLLHEKKRDVPTATEVKSYEWRYYENRTRERQFKVESARVREYFPLPTVLSGMLDVYQQLFAVRFEPEPGPTWHEDVERFAVKRGAETVAIFYLDLFPRPGKYGHAAAFPLLTGHLRADGSYQTPASAIVANFSAPSAGVPALLDHGEVETLFHEFGHIVHQILTTARFASLAGTNVKTDFVEAPSQMLENWVWDATVLEKLSGHWQRPEEKLPAELREQMIAAKLHNAGLRYLRQLAFAYVDLEYHTKPPADSSEPYNRVAKDIMLIPVADGAIPQASFGHLMGGYDAGYYSYLWSEVFAQDLFTRFEAEGLDNAKTGVEYVQTILSQGAEREPEVLLEKFLGRAPNEDAFLRGLGLSA